MAQVYGMIDARAPEPLDDQRGSSPTTFALIGARGNRRVSGRDHRRFGHSVLCRLRCGMHAPSGIDPVHWACSPFFGACGNRPLCNSGLRAGASSACLDGTAFDRGVLPQRQSVLWGVLQSGSQTAHFGPSGRFLPAMKSDRERQ